MARSSVSRGRAFFRHVTSRSVFAPSRWSVNCVRRKFLACIKCQIEYRILKYVEINTPPELFSNLLLPASKKLFFIKLLLFHFWNVIVYECYDRSLYLSFFPFIPSFLSPFHIQCPHVVPCILRNWGQNISEEAYLLFDIFRPANQSLRWSIHIFASQKTVASLSG